MVYVVTKIFGIDAVKTSVFAKKKDASENIKRWLRMIAPEGVEIKERVGQSGEIIYPIYESEDPTECVLFILKECKIK